ncbi:MAG: D-aminoacyl-tRNA deacylase [Dehalococcoidales bacterium]|nr:D-aminoacyl-tRNA deacylase [Dehalococcoidales bacterium]
MRQGLAQQSGIVVATGRFREHMLVSIQNDGPVTIMLDSREKFAPQTDPRDPG